MNIASKRKKKIYNHETFWSRARWTALTGTPKLDINPITGEEEPYPILPVDYPHLPLEKSSIEGHMVIRRANDLPSEVNHIAKDKQIKGTF